MNYGQIAIFDSDSEYANSLADYFRLKGCISSQILVFTRIDSFKDYVAGNTLDILLINHEFISMLDGGTDSLPHNIFTLCEQRNLVKDEDGIYLFKYTSADELLRQVMAGYKPATTGVTIPFYDRHQCKIIGIYSPVSRCGKTSFALALALHFSLKHSCVFLSFDDFSTIGSLDSIDFNHNKTVDDLLYYFTGSPEIMDSKLLSVVKHVQHLDVIPPSEQSCAIAEISASERVQFIRSLADTGRYDYIFMDIGSISPVYPILQLCQKVYIPALTNDTYSDEKINHFMASTDNIISDNRVFFEQITPPVVHYTNHGSEYIYSLTSGDMARFVSSVADNLQS